MFRRMLMACMFLAVSGGAGGATPLLISVDFGRTGDGSAFSGEEPEAAGVNSLFAAADTWNFVTREFGGQNSDPASYALVDSTGAAAGVTLNLGPASGFGSGNDLRETYLYWREGDQVAWSIAGLAANAAYAFYAYSSGVLFTDRSFDMTIGGETQTVSNPQPGAYFAYLTADADGRISGVAGAPRSVGDLPEANWGGFQLAAIPDAVIPLPAPALLMLSGLAALVGLRMARPRRCTVRPVI